VDIRVNGKDHTVDVEDDMPLLWVLRDELNITGPKYGCGVAQCGACTVHMNGVPVRSCQLAAADVVGEITTIEGLGWFNRPGLSTKWLSAATASQAKSCQRPRC